MPAEVESIAYAGATPWHGLGVKVSSSMTPVQMLEAAQLGWTVKKMPLAVKFEDGGESQFTSHFALGRFDGDRFRDSLGICGKAYIPTQNAQAFEFFREFTEAGKMTMETAGSLQGGRYVWCLAKVDAMFELVGGDKVSGYLLLMSPHIWGKSLIIMFCGTRVVCMNTLIVALGEAGERFSAPHIREFGPEVAAEAKQALGIANRSMETLQREFELLAATKVGENFAVKYVAELFQPKLLADGVGALSGKDRVKAMLNERIRVDAGQFGRTAAEVLSCVNSQPGAALPSSVGTIFGLLNAVTYFVDHKAGRSRDNALTSAWLGGGARLKRQALANALTYAGAVKR